MDFVKFIGLIQKDAVVITRSHLFICEVGFSISLFDPGLSTILSIGYMDLSFGGIKGASKVIV